MSELDKFFNLLEDLENDDLV
jgi:hypothetical protein